jgi:hypothetical protein
MLQRVLQAATWVSLALAVLALVLWWRSFSHRESVELRAWQDGRGVQKSWRLKSEDGLVYFIRGRTRTTISVGTHPAVPSVGEDAGVEFESLPPRNASVRSKRSFLAT